MQVENRKDMAVSDYIPTFSRSIGDNKGRVDFYRPDRLLRQYVRYYYVLRTDECFSALTFPVGCTQMIFHKRVPPFVSELNSRQSRFTISGQVDFPAHLRSDGDTEMIVVVFYPYTIGMFIGTAPFSFYNLEISGYDIENRELNDLAAWILNSDNDGECVRMIEQWLLTKLHNGFIQDLSRIGTVVRRLMSVPSSTVTELAGIACLGKRQFERVFSQCVGMRPKDYSRVVRFQKALWLMQNGREDYAGIAYTSGYADQSHFIREFRKFCGHTPVSLGGECCPYSDLFTDPFSMI